MWKKRRYKNICGTSDACWWCSTVLVLTNEQTNTVVGVIGRRYSRRLLLFIYTYTWAFTRSVHVEFSNETELRWIIWICEKKKEKKEVDRQRERKWERERGGRETERKSKKSNEHNMTCKISSFKVSPIPSYTYLGFTVIYTIL